VRGVLASSKPTRVVWAVSFAWIRASTLLLPQHLRHYTQHAVEDWPPSCLMPHTSDLIPSYLMPIGIVAGEETIAYECQMEPAWNKTRILKGSTASSIRSAQCTKNIDDRSTISHKATTSTTRHSPKE